MAGHVVARKTYYTITATLMLLLVLTLVVAWLPLGPTLANVAALTVAIAKALLVALFFMHVRWGSPLMRLFAVAGVLWLLMLMTLTASDYLTRPQRPERGRDDALTYVHPGAAYSPADSSSSARP